MKPQPQWRVARASRAGSKHRAAGQECQDHCVATAMPAVAPDAIIAAVADGMGSAPQSARGARIATNVAAYAASRLLALPAPPPTPERLETILSTAVLAARERIQSVAHRQGVPASHLATTLLIAVHAAGTLATAQIGDGAAVASVEDGRFVTFSAPTRGEYANETDSVTSPYAMANCRLDIVTFHTPARAIALMTDGMVSLTISNKDQRPHDPFFQTMTDWLRQHPMDHHPNQELGQILQSEKTAQRTGDDITLLLAVRP